MKSNGRGKVTLADIAKKRRAKLAKKSPRKISLAEFVRESWSIVEARPLVWEPHMDLICDHLEAVSRKECLRLVVNVPPGTSKSLLHCVFWPAWVWGPFGDPAHKWIFASYASSVAARDAARFRDLIESDWFIRNWGELEGSKFWRTDMMENTARGFRFTTTVGGQVTGWHADTQVLDDPTKPLEVDKASFDIASKFWTGTMTTRMTDAENSARLIVMQRLADTDLSQEMLDTGDYYHVNLPMRYNPETHTKTPWGEDWRTEKGELLAPKRFSEAAVRKLEKGLGPEDAAAQLNQNPTPEGGAIFKGEWLQNYWDEIPRRARYVTSWDLKHKNKKSGSYVCGQVWAEHRGIFYLVDMVHEHLTFWETVDAIQAFAKKHPRSRPILIEDKANGPAVMNTLTKGRGTKAIHGIVPVEPYGDKITRAKAVTGFFESGEVRLPDPSKYPWLLDYKKEMTRFPRYKTDDRVDATTQALTYLIAQDSRLSEAMKVGY